jgi:TPR repeat protein
LAIEWLERAAEFGDPRAMVILGMMPKDMAGPGGEDRQIEYLRKAVALGSDLARTMLGLRLIEAQGLPRDQRRGLQLLEKAAANHLPLALFFLATRLMGLPGGTPGDIRRSVRYLRRAARDVPGIQAFLGRAYERGAGTRRDPVKAREKYRRGADLGDPHAMARYAAILETSPGGPRLSRESLGMYAKAAERGSLVALDYLRRLGRRPPRELETGSAEASAAFLPFGDDFEPAEPAEPAEPDEPEA